MHQPTSLAVKRLQSKILTVANADGVWANANDTQTSEYKTKLPEGHLDCYRKITDEKSGTITATTVHSFHLSCSEDRDKLAF